MTIYTPSLEDIRSLASGDHPDGPGPTRRDALRMFAGAASAGLVSALAGDALGAPKASSAKKKPRAKACIVLWLNGGPSHIDSFDPKPKHANGGKLKAIKTRIAGAQFTAPLERLAEQAHKLAVIRSMSSKEGNHVRARYLVHTGYSPTPTVQHPSLGGWVASQLGDKKAALPAFVSIAGPSVSAGFLGVQHGPFVISSVKDPLANVRTPAFVPDSREDRRLSLLHHLEKGFQERQQDPKVDGRVSVYGQAVRLMRSEDLVAFDLSAEPEKVVKLYGDSDFGRGALMARKLVQGGVKLVEVTLDGFDTHKDGFTRLEKQLGILDLALSGLLTDLTEHKMLDDTLVLCLGEFGRTPHINADDGRDHYPQAWSAVLAGGGIKGGTLYGSTDEEGAKVDKPVSVPDLLATATTLLGLQPDDTFPTPGGRPIAITDQGVALSAIMKPA